MSLRIEYRDLDGQLVHVPVSGALTTVVAEPGTDYRLLADDGTTLVDRLSLRRIAQALRIDGLPQGQVVELNGFFENCPPERPCTLDISALAGPDAETISPASVPIAAMADDSFLMYAPPAARQALAPPPEAESSFSMKSLGLGAAGLLVLGGAGGGGGGGGGSGEDHSAPAAPQFVSPKQTADTAPVLSGTAEPGSKLIATLATAAGEIIATWQVNTDSSGQWRIDTGTEQPTYRSALFTQQLPEGTLTLLARAIDAAGNLSELSNASFVVDRTLADGSVTIVRLLDDYGLVIGPIGLGAATDDTLPTLNGTLARELALGERVAILQDGAVLGVAEVSDLDWSFTASVPISRGAHEYQARIEDSAGGRVAASNLYRIVLDDVAPDAPRIDTIAGDQIVDAGEKRAGVSVSGQAEALSSVIVTWASVMHQALADEAGNWRVSFASLELPGNGSYTVRAQAIDAAGNAGATATSDVVVRAEAPAAPTIDRIYDDVGSRTGTVALNQRSDDNRPRIDGHFASLPGPGDTLHVYRNGVDVGAAGSGRLSFDGGGGWSYTDSALAADGSYRYTARIIDASGQESGLSSTFGFVLDRAAPSAPAIDVVAGNDRVSSFEALRTLLITGNAESGSTVHVSWGDETRVVTATRGEWAADFSYAIPSRGTFPVSAYAVDEAGNVGPTKTRSVRIDTTLYGKDEVGEPGATVLKSADLFIDTHHAPPPTSPHSDASAYASGLPPIEPGAPFDFA